MIGAGSTVLHLACWPSSPARVGAQVANLVGLVDLHRRQHGGQPGLDVPGPRPNQMARQHLQALVVFAITWACSSAALELLAVAWPQASTLTTVAVVGVANAVSTVARFTAMRSWIFRARGVARHRPRAPEVSTLWALGRIAIGAEAAGFEPARGVIPNPLSRRAH